MIKKKDEGGRIEIDLTGPDGNAFVLIGLAKRYARKLEKNWEVIGKEMMSGDYENLIKVFDREFGTFVTLLR
jgi:hypothetical protein